MDEMVKLLIIPINKQKMTGLINNGIVIVLLKYTQHASILNGRTTPKIGGSTQFICMRNIYNKLDQSIQKQLDNLDAIHHFAHSRSKIDPTMVSQIELDKFPPVVHPMVKINPVNHKKLFILDHTKSIKNLQMLKAQTYLNI